MPIPNTREQLLDSVTSSFSKLEDELERGGAQLAHLRCVDDWSAKDLLAVRAWWTTSVVQWIEAGRRGASLDLPAEGYTWRETPRLNADIVQRARSESYERIITRLKEGFRKVLDVVECLNDRELLEPGAYEWAGKWPLARWISLNTARQYETARTFIRRAGRGGS